MGQSVVGVFDPLRDLQLISDVRVSEQSHLSQGEAVRGQPVGEHRLKEDGDEIQLKMCFLTLKCDAS